MVKWTVKTSFGRIFSGLVDDRSWIALNDTELHDFEDIVSLRLDGDKAGATIDDNKDGYFIGNKVIATMQGGFQIHLVGIGYWTKSEDTARIKWYNSKTMELFFTEARPTENCGFCLIKKRFSF